MTRKSMFALGLSVMLWATVALAADEKGWSINLKDADIRAFINQVAEITDKNFVIDPRVKGTVTVLSNEPLSRSAVDELFHAVLNVHGFAAVPAGDVVKIVPSSGAKQDTIPLKSGRLDGQEIVTRVIPVENSSATELVPILRPLIPQYGHLAGVESANALVIADHADNIARIEYIIRKLDGAGGEEVEVVDLSYARVGDVVEMLEALTPAVSAGKGKAAAAAGRIRVVADERSNRVVIKGDNTSRARLKELIRQLDRPAAEETGGIQVIKLRHADAEKTAEILKGLAQAQGSRGGGADASAPPLAPETSIFADVSINALVIRAEAAKMRELKDVIAKLDQRRAQVLIEAAIVEVSGEAGKNLSVLLAQLEENKAIGGVSFSNAGNSINDVALALNGGAAAIADGLTVGGGARDSDGDIRYAGLMQALVSAANVNLLSTPSVMTLDNEEALIVVGENVPFVTGSTAGSNNTNPFTTVSREDVGITLKVTPHVNDSDTIRLKVNQQASAVKESVASIQSVDLITSKREIDTTILAENGQIIMLGGLMNDDARKSVQKVPVLGDIPVLGFLFRASTNSHIKRNLLVFLRPTILRDNSFSDVLSRDYFSGVKALQFELSHRGDLSRVVQTEYPSQLENLFRSSLTPAVDGLGDDGAFVGPAANAAPANVDVPEEGASGVDPSLEAGESSAPENEVQ